MVEVKNAYENDGSWTNSRSTRKKKCEKWIVEVTIKIINVGQTVDLTEEKKWV